MDVGVIGLGTAGGAAAALLAREGHAVELFERVPAPAAVGAGIVLQPTGMAVLARLGLVERVVARGTPLERLRCVREDGRPVVELVYGDLASDLYGVGLHRGVLFEALEGAARAAGVQIHVGVEIVTLGRAGNRRVLVDATGRRHGPYDLVVVGDGARSRLAAQVAPSRRASAYPWGALWFVGRDEAGAFGPELLQVVHRAERMTGFLPSGLGPRTRDVDGDAAREWPLVSLYYSLRADRVAAFRDAGLAAWTRRIAGFAPAAEPLLAQIRATEDVLFTAYHDVTMWPFDDGNAVVLGDAAHAMSPQLGQGANLALWDAAVLTDCLHARPNDIAGALDAYSRERREHLGWFQLATRWLTPFFQGDVAALGWARDLGMPLACKVPWARDLMLSCMTGTATGIFSRLPLHSRPPRHA